MLLLFEDGSRFRLLHLTGMLLAVLVHGVLRLDIGSLRALRPHAIVRVQNRVALLLLWCLKVLYLLSLDVWWPIRLFLVLFVFLLIVFLM